VIDVHGLQLGIMLVNENAIVFQVTGGMIDFDQPFARRICGQGRRTDNKTEKNETGAKRETRHHLSLS
jgi:hypothetical protein